jgi:hypothetical protein
VIWNETDELFITSDNPSCFDYTYGNEFRPARYLPLTPRLALWTNIERDQIPEMKKWSTELPPPVRKSTGRHATPRFVRDMNVLIIQSAENVVLASKPKAYISTCMQKSKNWRIRVADVIKIPVEDGYYEVTQTRAGPIE